MDEKLKSFEKTIKKKHSFFDPKYTEEFRTQLSENAFLPITKETVEKLGWEIVYADKNEVHANRKEKVFGFNSNTERISATFQFGKVTVKSESLGNEIWDNGKNSKRVKLFIYTFKEIEKSYDNQQISELVTEQEKLDNWEHYEIPEKLPAEKINRKPSFAIVIIGAVIISLLLAFLFAFLNTRKIYVMGLFELLIAIAVSFSFKILIKISNYTDFDRLLYAMIGSIILIYISNQYFQYEIIRIENNFDRIGFFNFLKMKAQKGLNIGLTGSFILLAVQIAFSCLIAYLRLVTIVTNYLIVRVPHEVLDLLFIIL